MRKRRLLEQIKSLLIAMLAVSALLLLAQTDYYGQAVSAWPLLNSISGYLRGAENPIGEESGTDGSSAGAVLPMVMAVTPSEGSHHGVKYDGDALNEAFGVFSSALNEALGSSLEPEEVTQAQWQGALAGEGVYFDFLHPLPLSVDWLGMEVLSGAGLHAARRICLARDGDGLALYYIRDSDGLYYRCETRSPFSRISARLEEYAPNGAYFAWEAVGFPFRLDPYFLFLQEISPLYTLSVRNPYRSNLSSDQILEAFEMHSSVASLYTEPDGTELYVEGERSMRLYTDGTLSFRQSGGESMRVRESGTAGAVEAAQNLARRSAGAWCGEARLYLSDLGYNAETGQYTVCFDYAAEGIPICMNGGGNAVTVLIRNGAVTQVFMRFREYSLTDETERPLPELLASAIVGVSGGSEPLLIYEDRGERASLSWIIR
jgi:hypothetical protein